MANPNFEMLNRSIAAAGADWVAGETPYSQYYDAISSSERLGLALTPEMAFGDLSKARAAETEQLFAAAAPPVLPTMLDWRNRNGGNWVTPVRDQGNCGSCVAFATCAMVESRIMIGAARPGIDFDLSEAHLFYCGAGNACATGWDPMRALQILDAVGIGREASFPYQPGNQPCRAGVASVAFGGPPQTAAMMLARKQALLDGPVVTGFAVYGDFFTYTGGVYRHVSGNLAGYHAVAIVGFDDTQGCWIAKNSWRSSWGEQGFFRIRYGECGIDSQFPFYYPESVTLVAGTALP
jgi:C1A family cysteine protease